MSIEEIIERLEELRNSGLGPMGNAQRKALSDAIALLKTHPEAQPNEPLTQKQLQFMSSDPVWIVREDGADRWALIRYGNSGGINTYGCGFLAWEDLGKTWRAYHRPPKEAQ